VCIRRCEVDSSLHHYGADRIQPFLLETKPKLDAGLRRHDNPLGLNAKKLTVREKAIDDLCRRANYNGTGYLFPKTELGKRPSK
jgi:hypothetical protein